MRCEMTDEELSARLVEECFARQATAAVDRRSLGVPGWKHDRE